MKRIEVARRLMEIAKELGRVDDLGLDPLAIKVTKFLTESPNPSDDAFHAWAEQSGVDKHEAEAAAYRLATLFTRFLYGGRANDQGVSEKDVNPDELSMGIAIEKEHTPDTVVAKRVALDHLCEIDDYYSRLKKMEEGAKKKE